MNDYEPNEILDISEREINSLTDILVPSHVKALKCQKCGLKDLEGLPKHIEYVDCSFNNIERMKGIWNRTNLNTLICDYNQIRK